MSVVYVGKAGGALAAVNGTVSAAVGAFPGTRSTRAVYTSHDERVAAVLRNAQISHRVYLHTWIRMPGLVFVGGTAWACVMHGTSTIVYTPIVLLSILLCLANALHYGQQIIGNFYSREAASRLTAAGGGGGASHEKNGVHAEPSDY